MSDNTKKNSQKNANDLKHGEDTTETNMLEMILEAIHEIKQSNKEFQNTINKRILNIERELKLVRAAQREHGVKLAMMESRCSKRLAYYTPTNMQCVESDNTNRHELPYHEAEDDKG